MVEINQSGQVGVDTLCDILDPTQDPKADLQTKVDAFEGFMRRIATIEEGQYPDFMEGVINMIPGIQVRQMCRERWQEHLRKD